jgi:UDP-N-acetylglucosamine--N-acetylmuramyl-(pentapeptide) pyrophosphoryl-undecaprenol N-acetylglucosamine transferase
MVERSASGVRCLIAAGGTAGHVVPALAIAEALQARGAEVTFAGTPGRIEARLVPEGGFPFDAFAVSGFPRRLGLGLLRALWTALRAPFACRRILAQRRPDVVLGGGGYVAGPMVLAAWTKRIPAALTEADAQLGLANRLAAPFAKRLFLSFPIEGRGEPKAVVTGRPIPRRSRPGDRLEARRAFGLPDTGPALLVFGGSQGAHALNELAVEAFGAAGPAILHLTGERYVDSVRERVQRDDYKVLAFVDGLGPALAACDLGLARAGGSVWELAAAGLPAVLVPGAFATGQHQEKNARWFVDAGGAVVVPEAEAARAPRVVEELLSDADRLAAMAAAMRAVAKPDAAEEIADELVSLAAARR